FQATTAEARWFVFSYEAVGPVSRPSARERVMQLVSAAEKVALEKKREELYRLQLEVQERIRRAAALGDLSENAEYHFAKEENRNIQRQLAVLETKLRTVAVVATDNVPDDVVFLGHTVKLLDLSDDTEQLVRLVGEASPPDGSSDVTPVSINSPMGEALMKSRIGDTVRVRAPRGTMEFKVLEIVQ
ncbi:MAG: GreA/GreB family elongation factor, partial [Tepidisphaeraceae bacterium]